MYTHIPYREICCNFHSIITANHLSIYQKRESLLLLLLQFDSNTLIVPPNCIIFSLNEVIIIMVMSKTWNDFLLLLHLSRNSISNNFNLFFFRLHEKEFIPTTKHRQYPHIFYGRAMKQERILYRDIYFHFYGGGFKL